MSHSVSSSVRRFRAVPLCLVTGWLVGCSSPEAFHGGADGGGLTGDASAGRGGANPPAGTGGMVSGGSGGSVVGTGGNVASGGASATGGSMGTGGATATGGRAATGGGTASGGAVGSGGATATGGRIGSGGAVGSGGMAASGGRMGSGGAVGGVLFMDDFEMGTAKWITTSPTSDWSIVTDGSMVYREGATPTNDWRGAAAGNSAWTNIVVEARVKVLTFNGTSSSYLVAVCGRVRDAENRYCLGLRSDGRIAIRKTIAGSGSSGPAVTVPNGITVNTWYTARLQVVGSAITGTLLMGGTQLAVATDSDTSITAGGIQLGTQNATAQFDDVRVTAP